MEGNPTNDRTVGSPRQKEYVDKFSTPLQVVLLAFLVFLGIVAYKEPPMNETKHACIERQYKEIAGQCKYFLNSTPRCDLDLDDGILLTHNLRECCMYPLRCNPRNSFDAFCTAKGTSDEKKCENPMPENGTSEVVYAIRRAMMEDETETGQRVFSAEPMTSQEQSLFFNFDEAIHGKDIDDLLELMTPTALIVYNDQVVVSPRYMSQILDRVAWSRTINYFMIQVVHKPDYGSQHVFFKGTMCTVDRHCSDIDLTFKLIRKKKKFLITEFKNNRTEVFPDVEKYNYWRGEHLI
ncbi:unnamed protein product [Caenorhabditis auriculariae]|uniref:Uncharacterized protein n=1 Tax=Caenorhabditis auriculariae TaxID=2777116 RepID=A0A8S1HQR8_9PELO|nr:unnamed protein product [Caenorhabditis auriculariae]